MVGINIGANQIARARQIAWTGSFVAFGVTEALGLIVGCFPNEWLGLFSHDAEVLSLGALYLHRVAPVYGAVGLSMALYFASQGMNRVLWPVLAGTARMIVAAIIGWAAVVYFDAGLATLFLIVATAAPLSAATVTTAILSGAWGPASGPPGRLQPEPVR